MPGWLPAMVVHDVRLVVTHAWRLQLAGRVWTVGVLRLCTCKQKQAWLDSSILFQDAFWMGRDVLARWERGGSGVTSVYHLCLQNGGEKGEGTLGLPPPKTGELPAHHVADLSTRVLFTRGGVMLLPRLFCERKKRRKPPKTNWTKRLWKKQTNPQTLFVFGLLGH